MGAIARDMGYDTNHDQLTGFWRNSKPSGGGPNWICADTAARAGVRAAKRAGPACSAVEETVEIESMIADESEESSARFLALGAFLSGRSIYKVCFGRNDRRTKLTTGTDASRGPTVRST